MDKLDFKKLHRELYSPSASQFTEVEVPPFFCLMIDGAGDPNKNPAFGEATEALYAVAYTLKFTSKKELERDYTVPALEGLWWADDMADFINLRKDRWQWTLLIPQPEWITPAMASQAAEAAVKKKPLPAIASLRCMVLNEGRAVQIMHIGPYSEEARCSNACTTNTCRNRSSSHAASTTRYT